MWLGYTRKLDYLRTVRFVRVCRSVPAVFHHRGSRRSVLHLFVRICTVHNYITLLTILHAFRLVISPPRKPLNHGERKVPTIIYGLVN